jgi:hypothetical protein
MQPTAELMYGFEPVADNSIQRPRTSTVGLSGVGGGSSWRAEVWGWKGRRSPGWHKIGPESEVHKTSKAIQRNCMACPSA